jgi:hypothetical protein
MIREIGGFMCRLQTWGILFFAATISACGGGGGGSNSVAPTVAITEDLVQSTVLSQIDVTAIDIAAAILLDEFAYSYEDQITDGVSVTASFDKTYECLEGGEYRISGNVSDEYDPSSGDFVEVFYQACKDGFSEKNGRITADVIRYGLLGFTIQFEAYQFSVTSDYEDYSIDGDLTISGPEIFYYGLDEYSVYSGKLTVADGFDKYTFEDFVFDFEYLSEGISYSINGGFSSPYIGGRVLIATEEAIEDQFGLMSGRIVVTGTGASSVRLIYQPSGYLIIEEDFDGNGEYVFYTEVMYY